MSTNFEAAVGRFKRDKVVIAMVLAGALILGVGTFLTQDEPKKSASAGPATAVVAPSPGMPAGVPAAPQPAPLEPKLAVEFVTWWLANAMDYKAASAKASHTEAFKWMTADAANTFRSNFWTPDMEAGVTAGQYTAAFQPVSIQPQAINPDGTVVVGTTGTLVVQSAGTPMTTQVMTDFLVKRDASGLRIAGLYNRQVATAAATQY